ncbi:Intraflagellar transport protein 27 [Pleodorina starrii]|uniref:Intraflagellar transport protein 27 n=1 Tax=Pleodorina starrii TaxID=330485 RepID=A0A9W6BXJ0_9CHLO|nr:Intraflagellar transport protein 27 [Pleodorina starrii]GLC60079.1 Intraflagellar transport protein 27 [Pleodorina starrii]GLC72696.1 Intraflagellar transport protein 27 [Pleodorina starrii]
MVKVVKPVDITATLRCKVAVVGEAGIGKSSLVSMFTSKGSKFNKSYVMTSGVEVVVAPVTIPDTTVQVELYLLDTAGNELYKDQISQYWNGVYYALLVFDVSSMDSFEACKAWYELLKSARPDRERPLRGVLVANKVDLPPQRQQVRLEMAQEWATNNGLDFFDVSAAPPGKDYEAPFNCIAQTFYRNYEDKVAAFQDACRNY